MRPEYPMGPGVGVAGRMPEGKSDRRALFLKGLTHLQEAGEVAGWLLVAGSLEVADAVVDAGAGGALRQRDPFLIARAVLNAGIVPAAVFATKIGREIRQIDQLVRAFMRVVIGADDDVGTGADIGGHRRLRPHVLPTLLIDAHPDARR